MAALNCQPFIESADAYVKVDVISGAVRSFSIIDNPKVMTSAWSDNYEIHNPTDAPVDDLANVTVR